jgi:carboxylesterase
MLKHINIFRMRKYTSLFIVSFFMFFIYSCATIDVSKYKIETNNQIATTMSNNISSKTNERNNRIKLKINQSYDPSVKETNYSKILYGNNNTVVILLHGFIGSPFEVYSLGKVINKEGYTVFIPLIKGFGGNTKLANAIKYSSWRLELQQSIDLLKPYYSRIILIGFSLGGTIITDFLLNNDYRETNINGVILLAPYYSPKMLGGEFFNNLFSLFTDSISLKSLYGISGNQDLLIPLSNQEYYNSDMPLKAVDEIIGFCKEIKSIKPQSKLLLPSLLIYTQDDQTVNNKESVQLLKNLFENLMILTFDKNKKVRHQLAVPSGNKEFEELCHYVINFIKEIDK